MPELSLTVRQLAAKLGGELDGDGGGPLRGIASIESAGAEDVTFVLDARRASLLGDCQGGAAIVGRDCPPAAIPLIRVDDVSAAVAAVLAELAEGEDLPPAGIDPSAQVAPDAELANDVAIGPHAVIGAAARLGPGVVLGPNVTVGANVEIGSGTILYAGAVVNRNCRIGDNCRIGPNAVIGSCGFGYRFADGQHNPIDHIGTVEIGDNVDIGACSCVDRAKFDATRIGDGTKLDNLVQVAHNVQIGRNCVVAAGSGIAGTAVLKDNVVLAGHVGVRDNITLGTGVTAGAYAAIAQDVPDGATVLGAPANEAREQLKIYQLWRKLPDMRQAIRDLAKRLDELESAADH